MALACCTLALAAQDGIKVNFKGERPTINDFAGSYLSSFNTDDEEEWIDEPTNAIKVAWDNYRAGAPQSEGVTLTVDAKNGFVLYESQYKESLLRIEMCYWNEADGKHKLFAYNVCSFMNGKGELGQYDRTSFYRYDNATKTMTLTDDIGFDREYMTDDGAVVTYALPRSGKNIDVTYWYEDGRKQEKTLKFDGRRFSY